MTMNHGAIPLTRILPLLLAAAGTSLTAQTWDSNRPLQGWQAGVGYSAFSLRPATAPRVDLKGFTLTGRYAWGQAWSLEGAVNRQTGTDANGVSLHQWEILTGPSIRLTTFGPVELRGRLLVGMDTLHASQGDNSDQRRTFCTRPGLVLDCPLTDRLDLWAQVEEAFTYYANHNQRNFVWSAGIAFKL